MLKSPNDTFQFNIEQFYKKYLSGPKVFKNRDALETSFIPEGLPHRDMEIQKVAERTACALNGDTPPSFLCYGMTGTGKTATIRYVSQKLAQQCSAHKPWWIYINCNVISTPYRILAHIYNTIDGKESIPPTGLPKDVIFKELLGILDQKVGDAACFLVLDEIDVLGEKKGGNEILYDLIRLNENLDNCKTCLIGISNKVNFKDYLDPRVRSSLGEEYIVFNPYNASELRDILNDRAEIAFYEGVINEDVIPLCAALAAKENGDARKALQLLRKAGELAERAQSKVIMRSFVSKAQCDLENEHIIEFILGMPLQAQLTLTSIYLMAKFAPEHIIISGEVCDVYTEISSKVPGTRSLTERMIGEYIKQLTKAGVITYDLKSMGRYGRTKIIKLDLAMDLLDNTLHGIEKIQHILNYKPALLQADKVKLKNNIFKKLI